MFAHHSYMFRLHQCGRNQAAQNCGKVIICMKFGRYLCRTKEVTDTEVCVFMSVAENKL